MTTALDKLENDRRKVLRGISELGDLQPGCITSANRRCGKPSCHCAKPNDPGHGPHFQLTRKIKGKTVTQSLPSLSALHKAEREVAEFRKFQSLSRSLVEVNQQVCQLRPVEPEETEPSSPEEKKRLKRSGKRSSAR